MYLARPGGILIKKIQKAYPFYHRGLYLSKGTLFIIVITAYLAISGLVDKKRKRFFAMLGLAMAVFVFLLSLVLGQVSYIS